MEYINPIDSIKINEYIIVASKCWKKTNREINDIEEIKDFYNESYKIFHEKIINILNKYHPASWIRIAYIQLELWSINLHQARYEKKSFQEIPYLFIGVARYGWRYIIEISLENNENQTINQNENIPSDEDIDLVLTYMIGMSYCNEISNYIHYFKDYFKGTKLIFNSNIYTKFPEFSNDTNRFIESIFNYIDYKEIDDDINYFEDENINNQINNFLSTNFNFDLKDIDKIISCLRDEIVIEINASNLIMPYDELIILLNKKTQISVDKMKNIIDFIFLDINLIKYVDRDFLQRSQAVRMVNYAGCIFKLDNDKLRTVYSEEASNWEHIRNHKYHTIISFVLLEEWKDNFKSRFIYGQRADLKELNTKFNLEISKIEHNFNRNYFEKIIIKLFNELDIPCKSIEEINKRKIPCGEIDGIAIDKTNNIIYIIEAKNLAPTKDARAFGRLISDHYKQKKYHYKFLKKIDWVKENINDLLINFKIEKKGKYQIIPYYVTANPSIIKFIENEYQILTYSEFKKIIIEKYDNRGNK